MFRSRQALGPGPGMAAHNRLRMQFRWPAVLICASQQIEIIPNPYLFRQFRQRGTNLALSFLLVSRFLPARQAATSRQLHHFSLES